MAKPIIAVFNSSGDTVEMLRTALEADGLHTVSGHIGELKKGELDFVAFVEHHRPAVIVYDISMPYETNWNFLKLVRSSQPAQQCRFILTTTNKPALVNFEPDFWGYTERAASGVNFVVARVLHRAG